MTKCFGANHLDLSLPIPHAASKTSTDQKAKLFAHAKFPTLAIDRAREPIAVGENSSLGATICAVGVAAAAATRVARLRVHGAAIALGI